MKLPFFLLILLFVNISFCAFSQTYYVDAVNGDDSNTGLTITAPFKSIKKARDVVRTVNHNMTSDITVYLRGGIFYISNSISFGYLDSGTNGYHVIYKAYNDEVPVISGGSKINGWTLFDTEKYIYSAKVDPSFDFRQIYVNGKMATRARMPNLSNNANFGAYLTAKKCEPFTVPFAGKRLNWENLNNVEVVWGAHWHQKRTRISSVSYLGREATITFMEPENSNDVLNHANNDENGAKTYFYYENAYEFIDTVGEWYLNNINHTLYYKPQNCETFPKTEVIVPIVEKLIEISGSSSNYAQNIQFYGITFECSNWTKPSTHGYLNWQAAPTLESDNSSIVPGMVHLGQFVKNITFQNNTFTKSGMHAIVEDKLNKENKVIGNVFRNLAGSAFMSGMWTANNSYGEIKNNLIENIGLVYDDCIGIFVGHNSFYEIQNNVIRNCPYSGIEVGYSPQSVEFGCHDNDVSYNRISNVMQLHDDGAGIYTTGRCDGTIIHHNYISNIIKSPYQAGYPIAGLYLDAGSTQSIWDENVLDNTNLAFNNNYVSGNSIKNNFYNAPMGKVDPDNIFINNLEISGENWTDSAQKIISTAGIDTIYADLLVSGKVPGKIEAEKFIAKRCVYEESIAEAGGGKIMVLASQGGFLDYNINVLTDSTYVLCFSVASETSGGQFEIREGEQTLASVDVPNTGGLQNWKKVFLDIILTKGNHTIRIYSTQNSAWKLNWFETSVDAIETSVNTPKGEDYDVLVYPNPANEKLTINYRLKNATGVNITISNVLGNDVMSVLNEKQNEGYKSILVNVQNLLWGFYFVKINIGNQQFTRKIIIE